MVLPNWCNNNAFEFIRLHRDALESEYVSNNIHNWIDLIFGYKQTGQAAVDAHNVFYYLTYENALAGGIDSIEDELQKEAVKAQVTHFGQTPSQLFTKPHPCRISLTESIAPICTKLETLHDLTLYTIPESKQYGSGGHHGSVISISSVGDKLAIVFADLSVATYKWNSHPDGEGNPFQLRPDRNKKLFSSAPALSCLPSNAADSIHKHIPEWNVARRRSSSRYSDLNSPSPTSSSSSNPPRRNTIGGEGSDDVSEETDRGSVNTRSSFYERMMGTSASSGGSSNTTYQPQSSPTPETSWWGSRFRSASMSVAQESAAVTPPPEDELSPPVTPGNNELPPKDKSKRLFVDTKKSTDPISNSHDILGSPIVPVSISKASPSGGLNDISMSSDESETPRKRKSSRRRSVGILYQDDAFDDKTSLLNATRGYQSIAVCGGTSNHGSYTPKLLSCGYWDNSVRVHNLDSSLKEIGNIYKGHIGQITCICSYMENHHGTNGLPSSQYTTVVTGGTDGTCRVWMVDLEHSSGIASSNNTVSQLVNELTAPGMREQNHESLVGSPPLACVHILCGHDTPITAVYYSEPMDLVVSASISGLICLHTATKGTYIRCLTSTLGRAIEQLYISPNGYIVVFSTGGAGDENAADSASYERHVNSSFANSNGMWLEVYWLNGELLSKDKDIEHRYILSLRPFCFLLCHIYYI